MRIGLHLTTYNRILFTEQCLRSIIWSEPKFSKIVIVDNNSTDGTRSLITEYFMEKFPIIEKTIFNAENRHLGAAVVQGWNYLKDDCDVLGWINNDFLFEPGWEENLIDCFTEFNLDYIVILGYQWRSFTPLFRVFSCFFVYLKIILIYDIIFIKLINYWEKKGEKWQKQ